MSAMEQPMIHGLIEVAYSPERKAEMASAYETNCSLLISLLKRDLEKSGVQDISIVIPSSKSRYADIIFEFKAASEDQLVRLKDILAATAGSSVERISPFVVE